MSVCLSVCSHISKTIRPNFTKFSELVTDGRGSFDGSAMCYVLPVLWMTLCFHIMQGMGQNQRCSVCFVISPGGGTSQMTDNVVWWRSPTGGTGGEACRLRLHLVKYSNLLVETQFFLIYVYLALLVGVTHWSFTKTLNTRKLDSITAMWHCFI